MEKIEKLLLWIFRSYWRVALVGIPLLAVIRHAIDMQGISSGNLWLFAFVLVYLPFHYLDQAYRGPARLFPFMERRMSVLKTLMEIGDYIPAEDLMCQILYGEDEWATFFSRGIYVRYFFMDFKDALRTILGAVHEESLPPSVGDRISLRLASELSDTIERVEGDEHSWFRTQVLSDLAFFKDRFVGEVLIPHRNRIEEQFAEDTKDYLSYRGSATMSLHQLILDRSELMQIISRYFDDADKEKLLEYLVFVFNNPDSAGDVLGYLKGRYPEKLKDVAAVELVTYGDED